MKQAKFLSDAEAATIPSLYESGMTLQQIATKLDVGLSNVARRVTKLGLTKRIHGILNRKHTINECFFDIIDTEEKAYVLGFIYADGYLQDVHNSIRFNLSLKDISLLEKLNQALGFSGEIKQTEKVNTVTGKVYSLCYVTWSSKRLCEALIRLGYTKNKTFTATLPNSIPSDLLRHFFRGYFDGDGCIHKGKKQYNVCIIATASMCESMLSIFMDQAQIRGVLFEPKGISKKNNLSIKRVEIGGQLQLEKLYDYFYKDATIYLDRKQLKFKQFWQDRENRKGECIYCKQHALLYRGLCRKDRLRLEYIAHKGSLNMDELYLDPCKYLSQPKPTCTICDKPVESWGLCKYHYRKQYLGEYFERTKVARNARRKELRQRKNAKS